MVQAKTSGAEKQMHKYLQLRVRQENLLVSHVHNEPSLAEAIRLSFSKSTTAGRSQGSPRLHSGLGSPRPRARSRLTLSSGPLPAASPTASAPQRPPGHPRSASRPAQAALRARPRSAVSGRPLRPGPAGPAQEGRRQGRFSPATIHFPMGLLSSAGKPSRPSLPPESSGVFP